MIVKDITDVLEAFAPLSIQEKWDNSGLCIGSENDEVHGVLLGLDCTPELVDEAVACGADMIVTHHPLIFGGIRKISGEDPVSEAVIKAVKAGVSIYAAHTTADKVLTGVSGAMAAKLGLTDVEILDNEDGEHGLGVAGNLPAPMSYEEFVGKVKNAFGLKVLRSSAPLDCMVSRVALCGGSGSSLIPRAEASGAQVYVTGDISYHHFFTHRDFAVMDIGHYEGEICIVDILFSLLKKNFPNFAVCITKNLNSNPVFYF